MEVLKIIKPRHLDQLLKRFKLGDQVLFDNHLENWRRQFSDKLENEAVEFISLSSPKTPSTRSYHSHRASPYNDPSPSSDTNESNEGGVTLGQILNSQNKGILLT